VGYKLLTEPKVSATSLFASRNTSWKMQDALLQIYREPGRKNQSKSIKLSQTELPNRGANKIQSSD